MEIIIDFFSQLEAWHWLAFALVILGLELALGTIDLLWICLLYTSPSPRDRG